MSARFVVPMLVRLLAVILFSLTPAYLTGTESFDPNVQVYCQQNNFGDAIKDPDQRYVWLCTEQDVSFTVGDVCDFLYGPDARVDIVVEDNMEKQKCRVFRTKLLWNLIE